MTPTAGKAVSPKKAVARVAMAGLDESASAVLRDCFKQFGIHTLALGDDAAQRMQKEKFEALVVMLGENAVPVLESARNSPSNRRIVIYGIATDPRQALRYSKYGINSVLDAPVERQLALRVVRATHLLVVHELRRYVRIPVVTEIAVHTNSGHYRGQTQEISGGGMSVRVNTRLSIGQGAEVVFGLPGRPDIRIATTVCWVHEADSLAGLRFNADDERRLAVKEWIDDYLEIS